METFLNIIAAIWFFLIFIPFMLPGKANWKEWLQGHKD